MSPGTQCLAERSARFPSRSTFATIVSLFSGSISLFALASCHDLTITFTEGSPDDHEVIPVLRVGEVAAAASIIHGIGPQKSGGRRVPKSTSFPLSR
jgi:hypothetical protein